MGDAIKHGFGVPDNGLLKLGDDSDGVLLLRSAVLGADTALGSVLVGTVESQAIAGNSVMISNTTTDGDIALYTSKGGNSQMGLWLDGSAGDAALMAASGASVDHYIAGTKVLDHSSGAFAFQEATTISSTSTITINGVTSVVFNETGADVDFRIEGVGAANAFVLDAGAAGLVGIGGAVSSNARINVTTTVTASAGRGQAIRLGDGTITVAANADTVAGILMASFVVAKGAYTGLTAYGVHIRGNGITATGTGTIDTSAALYIEGVSAVATTNYAIFVDAGVSRFDGDIGATAARVPMIYTTSQTTTNAETVDSWGMTKQHITPYDDALAVLRGISVVAYEHKTAFDPSGRRKLGVLAESVAERMVTPFDEYVGLGQGPRLDMLGLAAINTRAIQQVDGEVEALRARVAFLELKFLEVPHVQDPD